MSDERNKIEFPNLSIGKKCSKCDEVLANLTQLPSGRLVCEHCPGDMLLDQKICQMDMCGETSCQNEIWTPIYVGDAFTSILQDFERLGANRMKIHEQVKDFEMQNKELAGHIENARQTKLQSEKVITCPILLSQIRRWSAVPEGELTRELQNQGQGDEEEALR